MLTRTMEVAIDPMMVLDDRHRRTVVKLILTVYWLLIFEGILRKWLFPQFGQLLFFIRDPFVMLIYLLVFTQRTRLRSAFLEIGCVFGVVGMLLVLGHLGGPIPTYLAVYGWRNYFFYIPLAFVIAKYVQMKDLEDLVRKTLLLAIPVSVLVITQFTSSGFSPINIGAGDDPSQLYDAWNFLLPGGFVRPMGPFTSALGQATFNASTVAMAMVVWVMPGSSRPLNQPWLAISTAAIMVSLGVSGSRLGLLWAGLVICGGIAGLLITSRQMALKAIVGTAIFVIVGVATLPVVFPSAVDALTRRWVSAGEDENRRLDASAGVFARAFYQLTVFRFALTDTPAFGYGLGSTGNASWKLLKREDILPFYNQDKINASEEDWGRNVYELGPAIGLCFIVFRIGFVLEMGKRALAATKMSGHPLPWLLCVFIGNALSWYHVTAHGTVNGYSWVFAGFCMAATQSVLYGSEKSAFARLPIAVDQIARWPVTRVPRREVFPQGKTPRLS